MVPFTLYPVAHNPMVVDLTDHGAFTKQALCSQALGEPVLVACCRSDQQEILTNWPYKWLDWRNARGAPAYPGGSDSGMKLLSSQLRGEQILGTQPNCKEQVSKGQLDLTELIGVPLPPSVSFTTGYEGFPAYSFGPEANVGRLTRTFVPDPFYRDFAIIATVKPTAGRGGVLFAITDALQKVVYLGVALSPVEDQTQRIVLYYSEPGSSRSQEAASFKVPNMSGKWNRFTLTMQDEEVRLYMDCEEYHRVALNRSPGQLRFEVSSGIFVGNAGGTGLERFVVS
ncbi:hypothetical protein Z043_121513 [Scleropages formosus]|uniref:Thrombospondin-like N-terminal domain-containing protein n=1 Tax=Scleropages formosus TaxID=113540 RepID=A0A0P7WBX9_SCLFO|nr:hypothetical protein Z043_121513 [Scleropages formosus]